MGVRWLNRSGNGWTGGLEMDVMRIEITVEGCEFTCTGFVRAACDLQGYISVQWHGKPQRVMVGCEKGTCISYYTDVGETRVTMRGIGMTQMAI